MYNIDGQQYSDQQISDLVWEKTKQKMAHCRALATQYLSTHPRTPYYALTYSVDSGERVIHVPFTPAEVGQIRQCLDKFEADMRADPSLADCKGECLESLDIDYLCHIPEHDMHWAGGEPRIQNVDLADVKFLCRFQVYYDSPLSRYPAALQTRVLAVELTDQEYVELLALRLFDEHLTVYDLRALRPQLFEHIMDIAILPHSHSLVQMVEIPQAAESIISALPADQRTLGVADSPFTGIALHQILNENRFREDDAQLFDLLCL